jgi:hypothetical protein
MFNTLGTTKILEIKDFLKSYEVCQMYWMVWSYIISKIPMQHDNECQNNNKLNTFLVDKDSKQKWIQLGGKKWFK